MPTVCKIIFENADNVFYGGQLMIGHVGLTLTKAKVLRAQITLQPGRYSYDFQCNLPLGLPTSLEHKLGHIRYKAKVVLERALWFNQEYEVMFTVLKPLDLNLDPSLKMPAVQKESKEFMSFLSSKRMSIVARIPVRGYTPGQTINVEIDVDNKSAKEADFSVQLWKHIAFKAGGSKRNGKILICENDRIPRCGKTSMKSFRARVMIPPIPPTDFETSKICKVQYTLRVDVSVSGLFNDIKFDFPITIGTYPILDAPNTQGYRTAPIGYNLPVSPATANRPIVQPPTAGFNKPSAPGGFSEPAVAPPSRSAPYPESDPPTYEQAMATKGNEANDKYFRPNYPVYRRNTSYSSNE